MNDPIIIIRRAMGYVENGTSQTVKFIQDDATKDFFAVCGVKAFSGNSLTELLEQMDKHYTE